MSLPDRLALPVGWILSLLLAGAAMAQTPAPGSPGPPESPSEAILAPVIVTAPPPVSSSSELLIPGRDFELRPQGRPADVLRYVPGLMLGQHQGGGKSEQYILRGFDGTDVALFLDGMPINLRSHAHGQGYADQHFVIPETLKQVDAFAPTSWSSATSPPPARSTSSRSTRCRRMCWRRPGAAGTPSASWRWCLRRGSG